MKKQYRIFFALCAFPLLIQAQLPKGTDVWLFDCHYDNKTRGYAVGAGSDISQNPGYDNQPAFSPSGDYLLYTSDRGDGQTDIYKYDFRQKKNDVYLDTKKTSEYSPTFVPGNKYVSTVRVEADSAQRLWKINKASKNESLVLPKVFGVGYHCWYDDNTVFLFVLSTPVSIKVADVSAGSAKVVADSVGRCMQVLRTPRYKYMLFTEEQADGNFLIKAANSAGVVVKEFTPIPALAGSQDFVVDANGNLLMAKGSKLYIWNVAEGKEWRETADLSFAGIKSITRLALDKDGKHIALVDNK